MGRDEIMKHGVWAVSLLTAAVLGISVLWLHIRRSKHARLGHCLWLLGVAGFLLYLCAQPGGTRAPLPLVPFVIVFSVSIVGWAYFLRSRRVRNTFVR